MIFSDEEELFLKELQESFKTILEKLQVKTINPGQPLKAKDVYKLFAEFEKNYNERKVPDVRASFSFIMDFANQRDIAQTLKDYELKIADKFDTIPKNTNDLFDHFNMEHEKFKAEAISNFRNKTRLGGSEKNAEYLDKLKQVGYRDYIL